MSPQEKQVLHDFLNQLVDVRGVVKDHEADEMIDRAVAQQPDATYLLVQRALLLEQALNNAKTEITTLQNRVRRGTRPSSSFLDADTWGNRGAAQPAHAPQPAPYSSAPYQMPPSHSSGPGFLRGGMGSMLGTAAATAAGVAAGAFLFHGIGNLLENDNEGGKREGSGLLGQQDDASAQDAFPGLTRPGESNSSQDDSALNSDTSSGFVDDQGGDFFDDGGGDDSLFG